MPQLQSLFTVLIITAIALCQSLTVEAQESTDVRFRIVPEDCIAYVHWASLADLKSSGSPSEDWLGQPELQLMSKKLFSAIDGYLESNPIDDEIMNEFVTQIPSLLYDCPATFSLGGFDKSKPFESGYGTVAIKLGKHKDFVEKMLTKMIDQKGGDSGDITKSTIDGMDFFQVESGPGTAFEFGIRDDVLLAAMSDETPMQKAIANLKTAAPKWLKPMKAELGVERPFVEFFVDTKSITEMGMNSGGMDELPEFLKFEEAESIVGSLGLDSKGFIASMFLKCAENPTGVLSAFNGKPIDLDSISELPNDSLSTAAARIPLDNIFKLITQSAATGGAEDQLQMGMDEIKGMAGLDVESEILDSFEGTLYGYSQITGAAVFSLKVKDEDVFSKRLDTFVKSFRVEVEGMEGAQFTEKDFKDTTIYSLTQPAFLGPSISWCHWGDQFYLGQSPTGISSHLRRRGRTRSRLIDDERFKSVFEMGESKGWGKPMLVSHVDVATTMQVLLPIVQTFVGSQSIPDFDFTFEDVPSVEVLTKNVEANLIAAYRTKDGIRVVERSTIPGLSSVGITGVAVGMMLPAIQQTRAAARRVTTMNNMRQLMLAMHNYESTHGHFPPAYSVDKDGKPLLSWRVHVLPYLDEQELYDEFRLDEPWDSDHNKQLLEKMPAYFQNPQASPGKNKTTFLGVGGKNGTLPGSDSVKFGQIIDGSSNTISIVDVNRQNAVNWTEPKDFDPDNVNDLQGMLEGTWPGNDFMAARADGSVSMERDLSDEEILKLMNIRDTKEDN